jgi:hypothetical protein
MNALIDDETLYRDLSYSTSLNDGIEVARETREISETGLVVGFSVISAIFVVVAVLVVRCNWYCREFQEWNAIRLTMPGLCLLLSIQTATMAYDHTRQQISSQWSIAMYMISSVIAPGEYSETPAGTLIKRLFGSNTNDINNQVTVALSTPLDTQAFLFSPLS